MGFVLGFSWASLAIVFWLRILAVVFHSKYWVCLFSSKFWLRFLAPNAGYSVWLQIIPAMVIWQQIILAMVIWQRIILAVCKLFCQWFLAANSANAFWLQTLAMVWFFDGKFRLWFFGCKFWL
jgi:hypothetical protein